MITLDEGIIPMNFNWRSNQPIQQGYQYNQQTSTDIFKYNDYSVVILNKLIKGIDNLIYGNARVGFSIAESIVLENSILNKCYEILNQNKRYIDRESLLKQIQQYEIMYSPIYNENCSDITNTTNYLSFNSITGKVYFNPASLQNIVYSWLNENGFVNSNVNVIQING